ncbi:MAG TPA: ATP-binding cassette domain-containing protein, partial [Spirochaetia bacterium]|nr:ATP-binding cassette domain-containing protein [Spirochaetia bacterium]
MTRLRIDNLTHTYPRSERPAVSNVSLEVEPGELLCLVGPSGCGKTTLLKIISGLLAPSEGGLFFDGQDVTGVPPEQRRAVMV